MVFVRKPHNWIALKDESICLCYGAIVLMFPKSGDKKQIRVTVSDSKLPGTKEFYLDRVGDSEYYLFLKENYIPLMYETKMLLITAFITTKYAGKIPLWVSVR